MNLGSLGRGFAGGNDLNADDQLVTTSSEKKGVFEFS